MNYETLCRKVLETITETGSFIRNEGAHFDTGKIEYKGFNDLVSYVDKQAEAMLVDKLQPLLPGAGFVTEEKTVDFSSGKYYWIIDPLDGTTNFIHGLPTYSISVALYDDGQPVIGIVYEMNRDELFYAWKNGGAYLNGRKIAVSKNQKVADSLIATGFPYYQFDKLQQYIRLLTDILQACHGVRRVGSAAVDLAYTACGRYDAYFEYNLNAWDVAGGAMIVREAGGHICNFSGGAEFIDAREILATNGIITEEMLTFIKASF